MGQESSHLSFKTPPPTVLSHIPGATWVLGGGGGSWLFPVVWDQNKPVTYGDIQGWQLPNTMPIHTQI